MTKSLPDCRRDARSVGTEPMIEPPLAMERRRTDRIMTVAVTVIAAVMQFWVAVRSDGSDWYISQTHADIFYTAVARFHQFPFFSFVFNGGTYFLQDPQNNLFSPT